MAEPATQTTQPSAALVSPDSVQATIDNFTALDKAGDKGTMTKLAQRLNKDQPALLRHAAKIKADKGDLIGEAAVFYSTLVWAMFERQFGKQLPRLLPDNLSEAVKIVDADLAAAALGEAPIHERFAPGVKERQPHVAAKLAELIAEDIKESAITAETATAILPPTQAVVEAFDAAVAGRRPGQNLAPVVRVEPKVGRNDPCPCGSGKKHKHCCG